MNSHHLTVDGRRSDAGPGRPRARRVSEQLALAAVIWCSLLLLSILGPVAPAHAKACNTCSEDGQRACCVFPADGDGFNSCNTCDSGLAEFTPCVGTCACDTPFSSAGVCRPVGCGGDGERACCGFPSTDRAAAGTGGKACDDGLTELVQSNSGQCSGPAAGNLQSNGICVPVTACGGPNERGCCTDLVGDPGEFGCDADLAEVAGCGPDDMCLCDGDFGAKSSTTCYPVTDCGGKGERACCVSEQVPSCDNGLNLVEVVGCSGDCTCPPLLVTIPPVSAGTCTLQENIAEPSINGTPDTTGPVCALRGYMDMHLHLSADLANGGAVLAGTPYDPGGGVNAALGQDFGTNRDLVADDGGELSAPLCPPDFPNCGSKPLHGLHTLIEEPIGSDIGTKDGATGPVLNLIGGGGYLGAPSFGGWPKWTTTTHQQSYYKWLERAWRGGLRLVTNFAVSNTALCKTSKRFRDTNCDDIMSTIDLQIVDAYNFETFIDNLHGGAGQGWFRIVTTPAQARQVISAGKLAVVLGIEVDHLFNCRFPHEACTIVDGFIQSCDMTKFEDVCSESFVSAEVDRYYDMGVRHIFPIHNFDNSFGGSATWQDGIEVGNRVTEKHWWSTRDCSGEGYNFGLGGLTQVMISLFKFSDEISADEAFNYLDTRNDTASCNEFGLFPLGEFLVNKLMDKGMIIDLDHMSTRAFSDAMDIAESRNYSAMAASHVQFFDLNEGGDSGNRHERMRTLSQLNRIKNVGGMIAPMTKDDVQDTADKGKKKNVAYGTVVDNCRHSSRTFAQMYEYSIDKMGGPVAFGTDFNGVAGHVGPRFGSEACGGDGAERSEQARFENTLAYPFTIPDFGVFNKQVTGHKTFDYNVDGLAHIGLLPDLVADLKVVGLTNADLDPLFRGAAAYIDMWDQANGTFVATPTASCSDATVKANASCVANASIAVGSPESDERVSVSQSPAGPYSLGTTAVGLTVIDVCGAGGTTTCSAKVTVVDTTNPGIACASDVTAECAGAATTASFSSPTATDNCDSSPTTSCSPGSGSGFAFGTTAVSCTATDAASNQASCGLNVNVVDTTKPRAFCKSDLLVQLDPSGNGSIGESAVDNGSSDICAGVTFDTGVTSFTCADVGANSPVLTVTDAVGLTDKCTAGVSVVDGVPPVALCKSISATLEQDGTASVLASAIDNGSTDACGVASTSLSPNFFECATDVGANPVILTVTDVNGNQSSCNATVTVLKRTTTLVYQGDALGQYSDGILLKATLTDTATGNPLAGKTVSFTLGSQSASATTDANGVATVSPDLLLDQPATATSVGTSFTEDCTYLASSDTDAFEIKTEDASVSFDEDNPVAVKVDTDGGDSPPFSLTIYVNENLPDLPDDGTEAPGDISLAVASMVLVPVGPGGSVPGTCAPQNAGSIAGDSYDDVLEVSCDFDDVAVNVYSVFVTVNGVGYYAGMGEDGVVIYDPSLGFTTGGGRFFWPGTTEKTNFGYTMKYSKKGQKAQGSLLVIRHRPDGNIYRLKSNAITGLALSPMNSSFGWASFSGKGTFKDWDWEDPIGNHEFNAYVEDHGEPGENDRFWVEVLDKDGESIAVLSMDEPATANAITLNGGNIAVPHTQPGIKAGGARQP